MCESATAAQAYFLYINAQLDNINSHQNTKLRTRLLARTQPAMAPYGQLKYYRIAYFLPLLCLGWLTTATPTDGRF